MFIHSISMNLHNVIEIILRYLERCINLFHVLHIMTIQFTYNQIVSHLILDPIGNHMHKRVRFKLWLKKCYINASFNLSKSISLHQMLMVHEKEGSWNMCSEYRELIKMTIKEKFLVIVIDEIFYELQGVIFFTKLGRHFGYHQIKIRKHDIIKTTFRTHGGHYEILVIPFVLTSAP